MYYSLWKKLAIYLRERCADYFIQHLRDAMISAPNMIQKTAMPNTHTLSVFDAMRSHIYYYV